MLSVVRDSRDHSEPDCISADQEACSESMEEGGGVRWLDWKRNTGSQLQKVYLGLVVATNSEACFDLLRRAFITKFSRERDLPGGSALLPRPPAD